MPTLVIEEVPQELYEEILRLAKEGTRTISQEALKLLKQGLDVDGLIYSYSAPFDLPRPGKGIPVQTRWGGERLPTRFEL